MRSLGFEFEETMTGTYTRAGHPDQQGEIRLRARARAGSVLKHVRDGMVTLEGTLDMEGFADDVPVAGTIEIRPVGKKIIRYDFSFLGNDGNPYRFVGQKDIRYSDLVRTMTTCHGAIATAGGEEVARVTLRFDVKADFLPFLVSWKPAMV
ncbi:MAG TPA: hypothetical protein VKE22_15025 [Haliangiales bacterium]|nr:hypothetical protein [Haliangiales bacterium]